MTISSLINRRYKHLLCSHFIIVLCSCNILYQKLLARILLYAGHKRLDGIIAICWSLTAGPNNIYAGHYNGWTELVGYFFKGNIWCVYRGGNYNLKKKTFFSEFEICLISRATPGTIILQLVYLSIHVWLSCIFYLSIYICFHWVCSH